MAEIEKSIVFKIENQFPAIYREEGRELINLVEDYYRFLETQPNQSVYNARRMFEYRDIGTTLSSMIIFFQKKYLADLPLLEEENVRFVVKNILDLYRRKGTESGILLFFRLFFQEDVQIVYPSKYMLKPSDSEWRTGIFLQLFPNNNVFESPNGISYTYLDLLSQNIIGSISKAKAVVDRINFISISGTITPVVYLTSVKGNFVKYDDIVCRINGEDVRFGTLNGSASSVEIDLEYGNQTTGNKVGDIFNIQSATGIGGKVIVTEIQDQFTGTIEYTVKDGGYGYTVDNTSLLVSNQAIILKNEDLDFVILETLRDSAGNEGVVIGQNSSTVGVRMRAGEEFDISRAITTVDRATNVTIPVFNRADGSGRIFSIAPKNDTSPGLLLPENGDANTDVQIEKLGDIQTVSLITDVIQGYVNVNINASNYNDPPATQPMSGAANPVNLSTPLNQAFDLTPFDIGRIISFKNINPGEDYINDVFALARDESFVVFDRYEQVLVLENFSALFSVGDVITDASTGTKGLITSINPGESYIGVRPYSYYGFNSNSVISFNNALYNVVTAERNYNSKLYGFNAQIGTETLFTTGRIAKVRVINSGLGYVDGQEVFIVDDDGEIQARGIIRCNSQGITEGFWGKLTSHLNGYRIKKTTKADKDIVPTLVFQEEVLRVAIGVNTNLAPFETWLQSTAPDGFAYGDMDKNGSITSSDSLAFARIEGGTASVEVKNRWKNIVAPSLKAQTWFPFNEDYYTYVDVLEYFDSKMKIQDSDYYQEYSYEIKSIIDKNRYEKIVKENAHLAGTKLFGDFVYTKKQNVNITSRMYVATKDDYIVGGDPIVGPNQPGTPLKITSDTVLYSVDTDTFTADLI